MKITTKRVALIPFYPILGNHTKNITKIIHLLENLKSEKDLDIAIFPELTTSGYLLENLVSTTALYNTHPLLQQLVEYSHSVLFEMIIGCPYIENEMIFNIALSIRGGVIQYKHRKIYLPTYEMFDEQRDFKAGASLGSYNSILGKTSVLICEDAFHPFLAYCLFVKKIQHVIVISASPCRGLSTDSKEPDSVTNWKERLKHYASNYGQFYYYINRSGVEDGVYFGGESFIYSPLGEELPLTTHKEYSIGEISTECFQQAYSMNGALKEDNPKLHWQLLSEAIQDEQ